jgi:hypothetical protein
MTNKKKGKVYLTPHLSRVVYFTLNYKTIYFTPELFKTGQITPQAVSGRRSLQ